MTYVIVYDGWRELVYLFASKQSAEAFVADAAIDPEEVDIYEE